MKTPDNPASAVRIRRILNQMRRERNLPTLAVAAQPTKITRDVIRQVAIDVWKKYPQSLTDPHYELGDLTLALVDQEIRQRLDDLRRGVVVTQAALKDYFN